MIVPDIAMGVVGLGLSSMNLINSRNEEALGQVQTLTPVNIDNLGLVSSNSP